MLSAALIVALLLVQAPAPAGPPTEAALRGRLAAYEKQAAAGKANPVELASIASGWVDRLARSPQPGVAIEACASVFANLKDCHERLWLLAKRTDIPLGERAAAAATLAGRKDKEAAALLVDLAKRATPAQFANVASLLVTLPAEQSVPLLAPMLASGDHAAITAACRVLGHIDAAESRQAIAHYVATAPRGTQPWFNCTFAAARLGDPQARLTSRSVYPYLKDFDLVAAAEVLLETDQELALSLLLQATRQARGLTRLEAADRLAALRPDVAKEVADGALGDRDPLLRAAALQVHRRLELDPGPGIRARLLDADGIVRLRAAEVILAWAARRTR